MKTLLRWLAVLMVLIALLPEGVSAQTSNPPASSGEIVPVQQPADVSDETVFGELPKGGSPSGPIWTVQRIDDRHFFSQAGAAKHYLKIDSAGSPHIVYGGDHLYHTWWSSYWHTEVVDASINVGSYASLAIDDQDKLHIAYYDAYNKDLKYATNAFGGWYIMTVASAGDVGAGTDIGVDAVGDPYFVYRDSTNYDLMFAALTNGNMEDPPEIINGTEFVGDMFSMASSGPLDVHVIFYSIYDNGGEVGGELYYTTTRTTTRWQPNLVYYGDYETGRVADIALDTASNPHVVFGVKYGELLVSRYFVSSNFGGSWISPFGNGDVVEIGLPDGLALVLNGSNLPTVAMQTGGMLYKYTWSGSDWVSQLVDPGTGTGFYPAVALYPPTVNSGYPAFAYLDDPAGKTIHLNYREIYAGSWWPADGPALMDQSEKVGACSTSLTGPDGNPWVIYSGDTTKKLYFKRFYNGVWTAAQEIGSTSTGMNNCFHAASAGGGKAAVLFTTEDARLLYSTITCTGASCVISSSEVIQTVLATPWKFIDLVLDGNGYPHMVYLIVSGSNRQLVYLYDIGAGWVAKFGPVINGPSFYDRSVSIKHTPGGVLHVAYQQLGSWDSLYYIEYWRGTWSEPLRLSVDNEEVYKGVSLSLKSDGEPGVVYTDMMQPSHLNLYQRTCGMLTCTWPASPLVVDTWNDSSAFDLPSLITDPSNRYRLSYVQNANSTRYLQYVRINGTQMEFRNVYLYPGLGSMSSLALSPTGVGRISFNDATNGDLLFAWQNVELFLPMIRR